MARKPRSRNRKRRVDVPPSRHVVAADTHRIDHCTAATFGPVLARLFAQAHWRVVKDLVGGRSGSPVYVVDATGKVTGSDSPLDGQYVLKLDRRSPWHERTERDRHRLVEERAADFARAHIPRLVATATDGDTYATLYEIAGHSLADIQTADAAGLQQLKTTCRTVTSELLTSLNSHYARRYKQSVPTLLEDWLGYRLRADEAPRLHKFVAGQFGNVNVIAVADRVLANPLWLARCEALRQDESDVNFVGWIHGDLHLRNILINRSRGRCGDAYWLIDFALAAKAPLFFDQAYLEVALLLRHFGARGTRRLLQLLTALDNAAEVNAEIMPEDAGLYACITELRGALTEWRDTKEPRRLDPVSAQIQLSRVAAGLNWTNKPLDRESDRTLAFCYAAWAATSYVQIHREALWQHLLDESPMWPRTAPAMPADKEGTRDSTSAGDAPQGREVSKPPISWTGMDQPTTASTVVPVGTVTMLFTDIANSTRLLEKLGDLCGATVARYEALLRDVCRRYGGIEVASPRHGSFVAFAFARAALDAAREVQETLKSEHWPSGIEINVRIGVHTGEPRIHGSTYWGEDVQYGARVAHAANGGQILVSDATAALVPSADLLFLGNHRLKDFPGAHGLHQLGVEHFPAPRTLDPLHSNLPSSAGKLIGRDTERAELVDLLETGKTRLVTVTGAGGVGKTRLALAVAEAVVDDLPDGAFFVPLAEVARPEGVLAAIAAPLGVPLGSDSDQAATIAIALAGRALLLVLDNFEHVLDASSQIAVLTASALKLRVLVTSRAPLRVRGEHVIALGPLEVPEGNDMASVSAAPAGRMLLDRVHEAAPSVKLTAENTAALAGLCRATGGLPLSIELAAPRLAVLSAGKLLTRIEEGIDALGRGPRDLPARQRGLRATLDWTYELLHSGEEQLLRRLSVFAGPARLERIERICGEGDFHVLEALAQLVDLSPSPQGPTEGSCSMPPFARTLANGSWRLARASSFERRHAEAFAEVAESWGKRYLLDVDVVQSDVAREEPDLGDALSWAAGEDSERFAYLAGGSSMALLFTARLPPWAQAIERALATTTLQGQSAAWLLLAAGLVAFQRDDISLACTRIIAAIADAERSGDRVLECLMRAHLIVVRTLTDATCDVRAEYSVLRERVPELGDDAYLALVDGLEPYIVSYCEIDSKMRSRPSRRSWTTGCAPTLPLLPRCIAGRTASSPQASTRPRSRAIDSRYEPLGTDSSLL